MGGGRSSHEKRPGQQAEANTTPSLNLQDPQGTRPRTNSMNVPVGIPVGPFGIATRSASE
jgi:hypothetical protein